MASAASPSSRWIDTTEFCRRGASLSAKHPPGELPRFAELLASSQGTISWSLNGERRERLAGGAEGFLRLNLQAEVSVRCERCLQPMAISVQEDRLFKLVSTEKEAEREDREADDHDVLVGKTRFDVLELVQDELIMALPIAPRHADCQLPQVNLKAGAKTRRAAGDEQAPERDSPFAVLARLKRPGSRDDGAG